MSDEAREAAGRDALESYRRPGQYVSAREEDAFLMGHHFGYEDGVAEGIRQAREAAGTVSYLGSHTRILDAIDALGGTTDD